MENPVIQSPGADLEHYEFGEYLQYFAPTWWLWDEEEFDILPEAGNSLVEMFVRLNAWPNIIDVTQERIFEARYELPVYGGYPRFPEGFIVPAALGFLDFVIGIPYGCMERIGIVGEDEEDFAGTKDKRHSAPPLEQDLFLIRKGMTSVYNLIWLDYENTKSFAKAIPASPELQQHWWLRVNLMGGDTHPVPGEFMSLLPFIFADEAWGWQRSSPTIFSGNWMETVFYTSGIVKKVSGDGAYQVQYRKNLIRAIASDWATYTVGDRVTILKEADNEAASFTWEDIEEYKENKWVLAPITFYKESE